MQPYVIDGIELTVYKLACLGVGLAFCYMGYRLFLVGIQKEEGNFELTWKEIQIKLIKAGPGTFYALFGAIIIAVTVYKGFSSTWSESPVDRKPHDPAHRAHRLACSLPPPLWEELEKRSSKNGLYRTQIVRAILTDALIAGIVQR